MAFGISFKKFTRKVFSSRRTAEIQNMVNNVFYFYALAVIVVITLFLVTIFADISFLSGISLGTFLKTFYAFGIVAIIFEMILNFQYLRGYHIVANLAIILLLTFIVANGLGALATMSMTDSNAMAYLSLTPLSSATYTETDIIQTILTAPKMMIGAICGMTALFAYATGRRKAAGMAMIPFIIIVVSLFFGWMPPDDTFVGAPLNLGEMAGWIEAFTVGLFAVVPIGLGKAIINATR
ncbi:hypothetical protein [Candidatus Borrarchaeum sp.]|uniref:hypothetical protein n=1 Tax=Candidatus Borrarchaeum sp. TaxID=2846742 RepID=UPI00257D46FC|nr:hypothetical protein [Candidatus Borrarchaeum sp.]